MVLQEHFGWKVGLPAFAAAAYTGTSRVADNQHWASDVVFGAALGMASGRTVTIHMRNTRVALSPVTDPGGIGVVRQGGEMSCRCSVRCRRRLSSRRSFAARAAWPGHRNHLARALIEQHGTAKAAALTPAEPGKAERT